MNAARAYIVNFAIMEKSHSGAPAKLIRASPQEKTSIAIPPLADPTRSALHPAALERADHSYANRPRGWFV